MLDSFCRSIRITDGSPYRELASIGVHGCSNEASCEGSVLATDDCHLVGQLLIVCSEEHTGDFVVPALLRSDCNASTQSIQLLQHHAFLCFQFHHSRCRCGALALQSLVTLTQLVILCRQRCV